MFKKTVILFITIGCFVSIQAGSSMDLEKVKRRPNYPNVYAGIAKTVIGISLISPFLFNISDNIVKYKEMKEVITEPKTKPPHERAFESDKTTKHKLEIFGSIWGFTLRNINGITQLTAAGILSYEGVIEIINSIHPKKQESANLETYCKKSCLL